LLSCSPAAFFSSSAISPSKSSIDSGDSGFDGFI
jgi:hypothetical protein